MRQQMYERSERLRIRVTSAGITVIALGESNRMNRNVGTRHIRVITRRLSDDDQRGLIEFLSTGHVSAALPFGVCAEQFPICLCRSGFEQGLARWAQQPHTTHEE